MDSRFEPSPPPGGHGDAFRQREVDEPSSASPSTPPNSDDDAFPAATTAAALSTPDPEAPYPESQVPGNAHTRTPSPSSLPPSSFATAAVSATRPVNPGPATAAAHAGNNDSGSLVRPSDGDGGLSHGELAAAIVAPVVLSLALIGLAVMCLRRRSGRPRTSSDASRSTARSFFAGGWKEKWGSAPSSASSQRQEPVVGSPGGNAYMTALDTSPTGHTSLHRRSGEYYAANPDAGAGYMGDAPPSPSLHRAPELPPLAAMDSRISPPASRRPSPARSSRPREPPEPHHPPAHTPPLALSVSPLAPLAGFEPPAPGFLDSSSRSINSDVYSETASVHSARAARMSIGGAIGVELVSPTLNTSRSRTAMKDGARSVGSGSGGTRHSDPFDDPNTPVLAGPPTGRAVARHHIHEPGERSPHSSWSRGATH